MLFFIDNHYVVLVCLLCNVLADKAFNPDELPSSSKFLLKAF